MLTFNAFAPCTWPAEHLDGVAVQHAAARAPVISSLQDEITGLKRELDQQRLQAAVTQQELEGMTSRLGEVGAGAVLVVHHMVSALKM